MRCAIGSVVWNEPPTQHTIICYRIRMELPKMDAGLCSVMKSAQSMGNVYYETAHTWKLKEIGVFNIILLIVKIDNCTHSNTWMLKSFKFQCFKWGSFHFTTAATAVFPFILTLPSLENSRRYVGSLCLRFDKQHFVFVDQDNEDKQRTCTRQANKRKETPITKSTQ